MLAKALGAVVLAPAYEELYFRGFLLPSIDALAGPVAAVRWGAGRETERRELAAHLLHKQLARQTCWHRPGCCRNTAALLAKVPRRCKSTDLAVTAPCCACAGACQHGAVCRCPPILSTPSRGTSGRGSGSLLPLSARQPGSAHSNACAVQCDASGGGLAAACSGRHGPMSCVLAAASDAAAHRSRQGQYRSADRLWLYIVKQAMCGRFSNG